MEFPRAGNLLEARSWCFELLIQITEKLGLSNYFQFGGCFKKLACSEELCWLRSRQLETVFSKTQKYDPIHLMTYWDTKGQSKGCFGPQYIGHINRTTKGLGFSFYFYHSSLKSRIVTFSRTNKNLQWESKMVFNFLALRVTRLSD